MYWGQRFISRFFTSKNSLFSSELAVNLLKNPNNYTVKNLQQIITGLEILREESFREVGADGYMSQSLQVFSTQMPVLINKTNPDQISSLFKSMAGLKLSNRRIWDSFESHILNDFAEAQPQELSVLIEACGNSYRKNDLLWTWFEDRILQLLDKDAKFAPSELALIFKSFATMSKGSKHLLTRLKEKAIEGLDLMSGKDYTMITNALLISRSMEKDILIAFIKAYDKLKFKLMGNGVATMLNCFVKYDAPKEIIDELEEKYLDELSYMSLISLSHTATTYAKKYGLIAGGNSKRFELMEKIEEQFFSDETRLVKSGNRTKMYELLLGLYWGLAKVGCMKDVKRIKRFLKSENLKESLVTQGQKEMIDFLVRKVKSS